jgi:hypothetical protein
MHIDARLRSGLSGWTRTKYKHFGRLLRCIGQEIGVGKRCVYLLSISKVGLNTTNLFRLGIDHTWQVRTATLSFYVRIFSDLLSPTRSTINAYTIEVNKPNKRLPSRVMLAESIRIQ